MQYGTVTMPGVCVVTQVRGAESCSKTTKQVDKPLAHLQTLTLDAVGPITEALEMVNRVKEEEQVELDLEKLGSTLEAAMTFLGNASTQISNLRQQKLMEDINKDLVPYTMEQKEHFAAQAPMLFGPEFMKNATKHWEQVKALRKMREKPKILGFQKAPYRPPKKKVTYTRKAPYSKDTRTAKAQK